MSLLIYFGLYFLLAFVWRSFVVYWRTGRNPFVFPAADDAYGYVGRAFKLLVLALAILVTVNAFSPGVLNAVGGLEDLRGPITYYMGWALLVFAFAWLTAAQAQMGNAWRIGIDKEVPTELVKKGLFSLGRNPIFLSMRVSLAGLLLVLPNAVTLVILIAGELLIQMQVRLEEDHLRELHGDRYLAYCKKVRRWL